MCLVRGEGVSLVRGEGVYLVRGEGVCLVRGEGGGCLIGGPLWAGEGDLEACWSCNQPDSARSRVRV